MDTIRPEPPASCRASTERRRRAWKRRYFPQRLSPGRSRPSPTRPLHRRSNRSSSRNQPCWPSFPAQRTPSLHAQCPRARHFQHAEPQGSRHAPQAARLLSACGVTACVILGSHCASFAAAPPPTAPAAPPITVLVGRSIDFCCERTVELPGRPHSPVPACTSKTSGATPIAWKIPLRRAEPSPISTS